MSHYQQLVTAKGNGTHCILSLDYTVRSSNPEKQNGSIMKTHDYHQKASMNISFLKKTTLHQTRLESPCKSWSWSLHGWDERHERHCRMIATRHFYTNTYVSCHPGKKNRNRMKIIKSHLNRPLENPPRSVHIFFSDSGCQKKTVFIELREFQQEILGLL